VHLMNHSIFSKLSVLLVIITVPLLLITMLTGQNINSAERWLKIPVINLSFQTSDFAKLSLTIYLARVLSKKQEVLGDFKEIFKHIFIPLLLICGLIVKQNFSTTALIFGTSLIIMFFGGVKIQHIAIVLATGALIFAVMVVVKPDLFPRLDTWTSRLDSYSEGDNEGNYQSNLSKASIVDGGLYGTLLNDGKYPAPPQAASDFMYSTLVKNFGLFGGVVTLLLYLLFLFRSIRIAVKTPKIFSSLLVVGLSFSIIFQAFSNMAVAVGILPVTGQPLPLISMGGTSIWFTAISIGIILSVSRENNEQVVKPVTV
jgi:cell division protein FtsW